MGLVHAKLMLANDRRPDLESVEVEALVDSGAVNLCIPADLALQLRLEKRGSRAVETADGSIHEVDVVAPVRVELGNRWTVTTAFIIGDEVLLGAIPMEDMDVVIDPRRQRLIPNPDHPNLPVSIVKSFKRL